LKSKWFNPEKSFLHLGIVWAVICSLLIVASGVSWVIITNTPLAWNLSSNGFNDFISIFRFPLGILTLIIPIVALLAANHRSEQTKEQIRVTAVQNDFANYYKHLEEFVKYVDKQECTDNTSGARYIHKMLYPNAQLGSYDFCKDLHKTWTLANNIPKELLAVYPSDYKDCINDDDLDIYIGRLVALSSYFLEGGLKRNRKTYENGVSLSSNPISAVATNKIYDNMYLPQSIELISSIRLISEKLDQLCKFSVDHSPQLNDVLNHKFVKGQYHVVAKGEVTNRGSAEKVGQTFEQSNERFKKLLAQTYDNAA